MRSTSKNITLLALLALALLAGVLPALADQAPAEKNDGNFAPSFGEVVDVRVINLEVVVTDGKERVSGLTSDDFRLVVDGEELPIEYFTEVRGGQAIAQAAGQNAGTGAVPALQPGEPVGTRYLVFIDEVFTLKPQRNRVLDSLREQLPHLGPQDEMAIVAFNGKSIDLLTSWTNSLNALERTLASARERPSDGLRRRIDRDLDLTLRAFDRDFDPMYTYAPGRYYAAAARGGRIHASVAAVVDAASSTLRGFSNPPGRKVMLLLSGGWPAHSYDWASFSSEVNYGSWQSDRSLLEPLVDTANRLGYTLYPVDVKGVESHFGGAEVRTLREAEFVRELRSEREWLEEGVLVQLARETGGEAILDGGRTKAFPRVVNDTRSYYWIGFTPNWQGNDSRHRVKVQVDGKGLKVRTRESFSDLSAQTQVSMMVESAQLFDLPLPNEQSFNVAFGEARKGGWNKVVVPVELEIPLNSVTLLPGADGFAGRLELRVAVTDDRGQRADIPVIPIDILQEAAAVPGEMTHYSTELKLRDRPHQILFSLYDPASGAVLAKRAALAL